MYLRIAGIHAFQLDYEHCRVAAERAVDDRRAGLCGLRARLGSLPRRAGYYGTAREFALLDRCYEEALAKGYAIIAGNVLYNEIWDRVHTLAGGLDGPLEKLERIPVELWTWAGGSIATSMALLALGRAARRARHARAGDGATREPRRQQVRVAVASRGRRGAARARARRGGRRGASAVVTGKRAPGHRLRHARPGSGSRWRSDTPTRPWSSRRRATSRRRAS